MSSLVRRLQRRIEAKVNDADDSRPRYRICERSVERNHPTGLGPSERIVGPGFVDDLREPAMKVDEKMIAKAIGETISDNGCSLNTFIPDHILACAAGNVATAMLSAASTDYGELVSHHDGKKPTQY